MRPPVILITDDSAAQRKLLGIRLETIGCNVLQTANGKDAFEEVSRKLPDAVVSDIMMPGLNGFELCQRIHNDPNVRHIPVVLCTSGSIQDTDKAMAESFGASAYVLRTPDLEEVLLATLQALDHGPPRDLIRDPNVLAVFRKRFLEDGVEQLRKVLDNLPHGINRKALKRLTHRWAGTGSVLGFAEIGSQAMQLEEFLAEGIQQDEAIDQYLRDLLESFLGARGVPD